MSSPRTDVLDSGRALRERAREAIANQPGRTATVLSSLLAAQDALGYLPIEAIEEVAERTAASINEVWGVASFYPNFRFTKPARHTIELCWGPTCHLLGGKVGTIAGAHDANISFMEVGRDSPRGNATMVVGFDDVLSDAMLADLRAIPGMTSTKLVTQETAQPPLQET